MHRRACLKPVAGAFSVSVSSLFRLLLCVLLVTLVACKSRATVEESSPLPVITNESTDLLFTWIDDKGEFHVEPKVAAVPEPSREFVRVADPVKDPAKLDDVFVADLRTVGPDGRYPVKTMARTEFEKLAVERRTNKKLEARPAASVLPGAERPTVIIYGASWCGPCHQAAAYLKAHHVQFVEKDIESDSGAAREMHAKLEAAGMRGGSIPIIDVKGKLMVGFDERAMDRALKL